MKSRISLIAAVLITPFSLMAQEEPESPWAGKATLGYLATSGNTENSTLNTGVEVGFKTGQWEHLAKASAIKASEDEVSTAEAYTAGWKSLRNITDANFVFGHLSKEARRTASGNGAAIMYQGLLVVRQDWHVHRKLAAFLETVPEAGN